MPFSHVPKNPGDLIKSEDWNQALDAIAALFAKFNAGSGHQHSGTGEDAPPIGTGGIADNSITTAKIQNAAITAAKLAVGTVPTIGVASTQGMSTNDALIPVPAGFARNECIYYAAIKYIAKSAGATAYTAGLTWDSNGKINLVADGVGVVVAGLAIGKKGGW